MFVKEASEMNPVPIKWSFRAKKLDHNEKEFLHKASCNIRGDLQEDYEEYEPEGLYEPVAAHKIIRMLLVIEAATDPHIEVGDVSNAYLYGYIDTKNSHETADRLKWRSGTTRLCVSTIEGNLRGKASWKYLGNGTPQIPQVIDISTIIREKSSIHFEETIFIHTSDGRCGRLAIHSK